MGSEEATRVPRKGAQESELNLNLNREKKDELGKKRETQEESLPITEEGGSRKGGFQEERGG